MREGVSPTRVRRVTWSKRTRDPNRKRDHVVLEDLPCLVLFVSDLVKDRTPLWCSVCPTYAPQPIDRFDSVILSRRKSKNRPVFKLDVGSSRSYPNSTPP